MDLHLYSVLLYGFITLISCNNTSIDKTEKVCLGTSFGLSHTTGSKQRYELYKHVYENCTYVDGNLEIVFLEEQDNYNLSFLSKIKEVTGYVLISSVFADYVPLTSLRIIRGRTLYHSQDDKYYSLYVTLNYKAHSTTVGLKELRFLKLYEILNGNVLFYNNNLLCYENTINWRDILTKSHQNVSFHTDSKDQTRKCYGCDCPPAKDSGKKHCWGSEPSMCQELSKIICVPQCDGRCYGELPSECCHPQCVGGCTGPKNTQCWACKNFNNDGVCEAFCPRELIYDRDQYKYVENPNAKYTYGTLCVNQCPEHLVVDHGACVRDCGQGRIADDKTRKCESCEGVCPKTCPGTEAFDNSNFINSQNIANFTGCTIISGNIRILASTFKGDHHFNISKMHPVNLSVLSTVKAINGYLMIQGEHEEFTSLGFFKNLEKIHGRQLDNHGASFSIIKTSIKSLDFRSPISVFSGRIIVVQNPNLCYVSPINIRHITKKKDQIITVVRNKDDKECREQGHVCSNQCSDDGCWGAGDDHCLSCRNYKLNGRCLASCNDTVGMYVVPQSKECGLCHKECASDCTGPGEHECRGQCKNYKDGHYCVAECPEIKYPDQNNVCQQCHENCLDGCTGPRNTVGEDACNSCEKVLLDVDNTLLQCMQEDSECDVGYHRTMYYKDETRQSNTLACRKCDKLCKTCWSEGPSACEECTYYKEERLCVENCSNSYYPSESMCKRCDSRCTTCYGPSNSECLICKQYKVYIENGSNDQKGKFNCTDKCPEWAKYKTTETNPDSEEIETVCVPESHLGSSKGFVQQRNLPAIVGSVIGVLFVVGIIVIIVAVYCQKRAKALESKERLAARMSGLCEESEITPLTPTDAKPDMATLRLIKESELRKGTMVGSGAFGTVYKGFWIPEGENVKIPVAIKVLQEGTSSSQNQELLEEARVMASVDNKYCVPILGVCMTAQMMLITPYMPLGCLLDYVRKNKENIGSKVLLDWCTQIATGMTYLEERGIVHRDLAARNVLVQNPKRVRVTDFGLSKVLDINESVFHAKGGKMPIKWLALECMQHRVFTHKSDVWSFGVTIWELFTYGSRPYETIRARDIPELLEKGERLPQPAICTIDVYMMMIKCWMLDAQSRPAFKELADEFSKMARDPGRYLVIHGDRLMRLPSHSQESKKDMFRNMSVSVDGPEEIVEAEEYLMPDQENEASPIDPVYRPRNYRSNGKLDKVKEENSGGTNYDNDRSCHDSPGNSLDNIIQPPPSPGRDRKYSGLEAAAAMRKQRENEPNRESVKSRYSSDPCKVLNPPMLKETIAEDYLPPAPPTPIAQNQGRSTENVFFGSEDEDKFNPQRLPVDEDDYLQPQSTNFTPKYLDVVQDDYLPPTPTMQQDSPYGAATYEQKHPTYPDFYGNGAIGGGPLIAENPEYFDSPSDTDTGNVSIDRGMGSDKQLLTAQYKSHNNNHNINQPVRSLSNETESDGANSEHDYYNETDLLNKKKTPSRGVFVNPRTESIV